MAAARFFRSHLPKQLEERINDFMISDDALSMLILCSRLGLESDPEPKPLTLRGWNPLARKIQSSSLKRPGKLLGMSSRDLEIELNIDQLEADNLHKLLDRAGAVAIELERLESIGVNVITRADQDYPNRYRTRLREAAPPVLFYSGEHALLGQKGVAIVGSRHLDNIGKKCAEWIGNSCGLSGMVLYSGGARGVDTISMEASLSARGTSVGVIANNMERMLRKPVYRNSIQKGDLCLITPYTPSASFNVGLAMGRNRLIYTLADYGIVVASSANKGGTWSGAIENMKHDWVPLFVIEYNEMPEGNHLLLKRGAISLPLSIAEDYANLEPYLNEHANKVRPKPTQPPLF
ncbi:MAG: DNA-processing protein DprA [Chloroflexota bacterium]|nr:DNA-processing protein DprA [Chloroflexota bacterium]